MNRRGVLSGLVVVLALGLGGCGDSQEAAMDDSIDAMRDLVSVLESIKDEASAEAAVADIKALGEEMEAIQKRMAELDPPTPEEMERIMAKYDQNEMMRLSQKMMTEMMRLASDETLSSHLDDAMDSLGGGGGMPNLGP